MKRAFTLMETIVVIGISTLITTALASLIVYFYRTNTYTLEQARAVGEARRGLEDSIARIREASYGSDGAYPIAAVGTSSITFYANVDNSVYVERVTYRVLNGILYRTLATPAGNPVTYVNATLATTTVAAAIVNGTSTPLFRYFDSTGVELTAPVNVSLISSVKVNAVVDINVNRAPVSFTLNGGATLRNLQKQL